MKESFEEELINLPNYYKINSLPINGFEHIFNFHIHIHHLEHFEFICEEEILHFAKKNGCSIIGICIDMPNIDLILPENKSEILLSELSQFISFINKIKHDNADITILIGLEAEFDPKKEKYLCEIREKVDFLILKQHLLPYDSKKTTSQNNPNYPIEYAEIISKAIASGLFDIISNPDFFMLFRDSIINEEDKKLFDENSVIASQIICEKASDMGIPIEFNLSNSLNNLSITDETTSYLLFWEIAKKIKGLKVLIGIYSQGLNAFKDKSQISNILGKIMQIIGNILIKGNYNPVVARQNNPKLQEAYLKRQKNSLTFQTHIIWQIINESLSNAEDNINSESKARKIIITLDEIMNKNMEEATKKRISANIDIESLGLENPNIGNGLKRKKELIDHINLTLTKQQELIDIAKKYVADAMLLGCESKDEYANIVAQMIEHHFTKDLMRKHNIEEHIDSFKQIKSGKTSPKTLKEIMQLTNELGIKNNITGFSSILLITLIVLSVSTIGIIISYLLLK